MATRLRRAMHAAAAPHPTSIGNDSPKYSVIGTVNIIPIPSGNGWRHIPSACYANNGFVDGRLRHDPTNPIPSQLGKPSDQIKHVIFINKENATHDLMLGDITSTRSGTPVNGEPSFSLGYDASPNHHELALRFSFSDNFFLEPSVSSDGHRWLTGQVHGRVRGNPLAGGLRRQARRRRRRSGGLQEFPGRIGFTDANASPEPNDYNEHGGIYLHLNRYGRSFVNFGNGYEFALIDEPAAPNRPARASTPTCRWKRSCATTAITCSPRITPTFPTRRCRRTRRDSTDSGASSRCSRANTSTARRGRCKLPQYVDLYYPNDHGGGATDINPNGPGLVLQALRPGQRRGAGPDRRTHLEEPVLERHRHLRGRGRHAERHGPRRRTPLDLPGHRPLGEEGVRQQDPHEPGEHLQDREPDPRPAAAEPI